ncbi:type II secretion system F family protein [Leucothrix arctica]|uniref:Type II secretion system protein F n=1 Tax=Leucothrix arctica TaxID=1481894 RepID=A0A317C7V1_9GAMM|nr:type II secretion system F family protein [Leucothrix arctica]PWQ94548.1 type II secretion system protein F [Leucothrix arctica]
MATLAKSSAPKEVPTFIWEGKNKAGVKVRGEEQSANANMLRATLRRRGINPKWIKPKRKPLMGGTIKPADIAHFARQLTAMMRSGIPLVQSLELIGNGHENAAMQTLIKKLRSDIESGADLGTALSYHPKHFDDLFVSLVKAGEHSGALEDMLEKIATYKEKTESMKAKVKKAMMYPIMVLIMALVVSAIMLIFVIPQFQSIFDGFGADLPAFTLWVIGLSEWLQSSWWQPILGVVVIGFAFKQAKLRSEKFNVLIDTVVLKIPVMGIIIEKSAIARFSRTLSTMFAAGVPMVEAMDSVAGSTGNRLFANATLQIKDDISKGVQLNTSMLTSQRFPSMVVQMTKIGEESGRLEEMLNKVADYFEEQVDDLVDTLSKQIEPLVMAVLGVIVGGLVIAMYLPIFKLGAVVG